MRKSFALVVIALLAMPVHAQSPAEGKAGNDDQARAAQEAKLKNCNAEVKRKSAKADDYRKLMRDCLSR
ncbi:MAG: PsiF family protein [Burkholderiales bacterium]